MYISSNTTAFLQNQTHLQVCFRRTCETTANTGSISLSPKKRICSNCDIVLLEHIFDQVKLIFIVLLFVGLIQMKVAVDFKYCLFFVYRWKMKHMKRSPLKRRNFANLHKVIFGNQLLLNCVLFCSLEKSQCAPSLFFFLHILSFFFGKKDFFHSVRKICFFILFLENPYTKKMFFTYRKKQEKTRFSSMY